MINGPVHVWDLGLIRSELAAMNLDWDLPPYAEPVFARNGK